ncbi:MAG: hypothetical protein RLZZ540_2259 [Bacteroidota bacterium]|jgi:hypothetical protein
MLYYLKTKNNTDLVNPHQKRCENLLNLYWKINIADRFLKAVSYK